MKILTSIVVFFCASLIFAQSDNEDFEIVDSYPIIQEIIAEKTEDYSALEKTTRNFSFKKLKELEKQSKANDYLIGQIVSLNNIARNYRNKTIYDLALKNHQKALSLAADNNLKDIEAQCLNLIGVIYRRKDDIKNALDYHQSAISTAKKNENPTINTKVNISVAENSLGNIFLSLNQYEKAIEQFNKAIDLQSETLNLKGLAINFQNLGQAFEGLKLYDRAMENYRESLSYNKKMGSELGTVICTNSMASVLIKQEKYKEAASKLDSILPISIKINHPDYLTETYSNLGIVNLMLGDIYKAEEFLDNAVETILKNDISKKIQLKVYYNQSELYKKINNYKTAYEYYKIAVEDERETLGLRNSIYVSNLISKQDLEHKINEFNDLQNETKIKSLQLARNRNILIITLVTIGLLSIVLYSMYRQHLLKNDQEVTRLEQQALQSQMNPHFIFNALNSIKLYIINNEQKNAVYYLNKFSKLIRNILDVSKVREVSLKEELSTMNLYMSIENIRFSGGISYVEKIHPDLNTDTIKVPPLVLQPFLENSIWHGLSSKEGEKEIIIEAYKSASNLMEINIIDNGIGRAAADVIKQKKSKSLNRKSVGIKLTTDRFSAFYNELADQFSLKYYDLKDEDGNPSGTKVTLKMPLG